MNVWQEVRWSGETVARDADKNDDVVRLFDATRHSWKALFKLSERRNRTNFKINRFQLQS